MLHNLEEGCMPESTATSRILANNPGGRCHDDHLHRRQNFVAL
jgi:hypothetical protein